MSNNNSSSNINSDIMSIRDWRNRLRSPAVPYRIGNRTIRFQIHFAWIISCFGFLIFLFFYIKVPSKSSFSLNKIENTYSVPVPYSNYNFTYPLTVPIINNGIKRFRIGIIADLDTNSKCSKKKDTWNSYFKKGYLSYTSNKGSISVNWDSSDPVELTSSYSLKGRSMELSELVVFNGKLLTFDDRTGFIYEIINDKIVPWVFLIDGDGSTTKGFKAEWATVKDQSLYVGSMGKEWTSSDGEFASFDPMYVKNVMTNGEVHHLNWINQFKAIRSSQDISWPGYMIHESGVWSSENKKWYFLPRRCSKDKYNETTDEHMACNVLISADENFKNVESVKIGELNPTHGFSSFKFIPGTRDEVIVALKTMELNGKTSTFIMAFTISGKILMEEETVPTDYKYEGLEFI